MPSSPVEHALQMIRSRVPAKVFHMLKEPLSAELYGSDDDVVDLLLALSQRFRFPIESAQMEPIKQHLLNAALDKIEPDTDLQHDIENMTVEGVLAKDTDKGCLADPLVGALFSASCLYPLKTPEARLVSLTVVWSEAAQDLLDSNA